MHVQLKAGGWTDFFFMGANIQHPFESLDLVFLVSDWR